MVKNIFDKKWNVIPIVPNSKRPAVKHVAEWYEKRFPREELKDASNFAVVCGATSNNLVVLDLDYEKPMDYITEIYPSLNVGLGQIVNTYTEHSPNGAHLFYYLDGEVPSSKTNSNSNVHDLRKIIKEYVDGGRKTLRGLVRIEKTTEPNRYHSIDILGKKKYCIVKPSSINGKSYSSGLPFPVKNITSEEFEELIDYFVLKEKKVDRMRKPFIDILEGKIEIESFAKENGTDEHVYWAGVFKEAWNFLGLVPEDIYPLLKRNQPAFDIDKTEGQLNSGSHNYDDKPLRNETLKTYFPRFTQKPKKIKIEKTPVYITIANYLMDKYDIVTIRGLKETMLIRDGNVYMDKLEGFYKDMAEQIEYYKKDITRLSGNIIKRIKYLTYFDTDSLCYDSWMISFSNGYYNIIEDTFYPNKEKGKAFCYEIPHNYNPEFKGDCTKFKSLLNDWLGEDNTIKPDDIFEMIGYSMVMNTDMKMAFFIHGPSHTGKTQFQTILEHVIGHANRCEVSLQRMCKNEFGSDGMQFKLLNMVGDMSDLTMVDVSMFKKVTGGDKWIGAEVKGGKQYEFRNIIKVWCNGNKIPIIDNDDDAFYGRWILIPFLIVHDMFDKETIKDIGSKLCEDKDEVQAIIHECIKGLFRLYKRDYFREEIMVNTKHTWRYEAEPLYAFIADNYTKDETGEVNSYDFRMDFNRYLYRRKTRPFSANKLNTMMEIHGIFHKRIMNNGERETCYTGITKNEDFKRNKERLEELFITGKSTF